MTTERNPVERFRSVLRSGLYALLVLAPLPFGSVQPWAVLTLQVVAACLGTGALYVLWREPASLGRRARWLALGAAALIGIGVVQLLPTPPGWTRWVATPTAEARDAVAAVVPELAAPLAPQSLSPPDTTDALLRLVAYALVGLAAAVALRSKRHLRQVAIVLAGSGAFQALYGSAEYLSGHQHIFGYAKQYYLDSATGTFINRNHYAGYLAATLPFALGLILHGARKFPRSRSWRRRLVHALQPDGLRFLFAGLAAVVIWTGVLLSYSRGGLAAAVLATVLFPLIARAGRRPFRAFAVVLLVPLAVLLLWQDARAPGERFASMGTEVGAANTRLSVWEASVEMLPGYAVLGSGFGTFESAFLRSRMPGITRRWDHAHNDWLEMLIEGGAVPAVLVAGCFLWILASRPTSRRQNRGSTTFWLAGAVTAVATLGVHGLVDFSVRIPAIATVVPFLVAMLSARTEPDSSFSFTSTPRSRR